MRRSGFELEKSGEITSMSEKGISKLTSCTKASEERAEEGGGK
jgi:hypothetical protein